MLFPADTILSFPMFEFEMPQIIDDPKAMEYELVDYLGFEKPNRKNLCRMAKALWTSRRL